MKFPFGHVSGGHGQVLYDNSVGDLFLVYSGHALLFSSEYLSSNRIVSSFRHANPIQGILTVVSSYLCNKEQVYVDMS